MMRDVLFGHAVDVTKVSMFTGTTVVVINKQTFSSKSLYSRQKDNE